MFIRRCYPLWFREKLFWRWWWKTDLDQNYFNDVPLLYAPGVVLDLKPSDIGHRQIACLGYVERRLTQEIHRHSLSTGGLLIDVGANYGYFSCLWVSGNPANRAIAFEASPRNTGALQHNLCKNGFDKRVTLLSLAAGKEVGTLAFSLGPEEQTGWGGLVTNWTGESVSVAVTTLDSEFAASPEVEITVLKIDTEGADTWVLQGCKRLLQEKRIRHIYFEENRERCVNLGIMPDEAHQFLRDTGYQIERLGNGDTIHAYA